MKSILYFFNEAPPHFFVLCIGIFMHLLGWGEGYRFAFHLNLLIVLVYIFKSHQKIFRKPELMAIIFLPPIYILLNLLSGADLVYSGEVRAIIFASAIALGVWIIFQKDPKYIYYRLPATATTAVVLYTIIEAMALWVLNKPFGTLKNPHYLALGSSIFLILTVFLISRSTFSRKLLLVPVLIALGAFIINTSSRPIWVGLICSAILLVAFVDARFRLFTGFLVATTLSVVLFGNIGGALDRTVSLIENINSEERVLIWQETWKMQSDSSTREWLVGHGLKTFEEDFKKYSSYHSLHTDFNSPHNYILESLYLSGIVGLMILISLVLTIYKYILYGLKTYHKFRHHYLMILCLLTANLVAVSIIVPLFSRYNLTVFAIVTGALLILGQKRNRGAI